MKKIILLTITLLVSISTFAQSNDSMSLLGNPYPYIDDTTAKNLLIVDFLSNYSIDLSDKETSIKLTDFKYKSSAKFFAGGFAAHDTHDGEGFITVTFRKKHTKEKCTYEALGSFSIEPKVKGEFALPVFSYDIKSIKCQ